MGCLDVCIHVNVRVGKYVWDYVPPSNCSRTKIKVHICTHMYVMNDCSVGGGCGGQEGRVWGQEGRVWGQEGRVWGSGG